MTEPGGTEQGPTEPGRLAMFPLSTVLFPHTGLPLLVFEERYRAMVADCLADDSPFGVVLISRGSEVGGGDTRVDVGTVAHIDLAQPLAQGRWRIVARGVERLRVTSWHPDDPYPVATVETWPTPPETQTHELVQRAQREVRRVRALLSELGEVPALAPELQLGEDPEIIGWRLCAVAPIGVLDRQRLLEAPTIGERIALLVDLVHAVGRDATRMLEGG